MSLGHYSANGVTYTNRFEAWETALKTDTPIQFNYDDEFWAAQDWKTMSKMSLQKLYELRAIQLRADYDYVILCYSGGADSWNILQAFERSNTHVDEIVSYIDVGLTDDKESFTSSEVYRVAVPEADRYVAAHPNTLRTIVDTKEALSKALLEHSIEDLMRTYYQSPLSILSPIRGGSFAMHEPRYRKLAEEGKKICLVWGWDKTFVRILNGRYGFQFHDTPVQANRKATLPGAFPIHDEFFYWSTKHPEMLIKQCHVVKTMLEAVPLGYKDPHKINWGVKKMICLHNKKGVPVSFQTLNSWLYGWDPRTFTRGRAAGSQFLSEQDFWVIRRLDEDLVKRWRDLVNHSMHNYYHKLQPQHRNDANPALGQICILKTQPYYVE